ncbi:MAG: GAF domain-containing protein [Rhodopirellula sp.]|nr:GAF domain-containing protein [Rhodopirellula sp.]
MWRIEWQPPWNRQAVGSLFVPKATLLVIGGVDQGARFDLDSSDATIGRGVMNTIRILDTEMSRNHASVSFNDGAFILTDRNSSNGTFANGISIQTHRLATGDQIQVGSTVLLFAEPSNSQKEVPVDLVSPLGRDDPSQIISKVGIDASRLLLDQSMPVRGDQATETLAQLRLLYRVSEEMVSSTLSLEQLLQRILDTSLEAVGADRGCVLVTNPQNGKLEPRALAHISGGTMAGRMPISRSIVDYVVRKGQGVRTSDARADSRFASGISIVQEGIREALCVPMPGHYELMGVIYVDTQVSQVGQIPGQPLTSKFTDSQLNLMAAIGRQAALAIENHRYQDAYVKAERLAAVGQTIAILSHHTKNILQGVRGGSYLIDMGLQGHDESLIQEGWSIVEKNQERINHLVMDMLSFSAERRPKLEPGSINELVAEIHELMHTRADEIGVQLRLALGEGIPTAMFDSEGIHRAVLNIVINALDALEEMPKGIVEIRTGTSSDKMDVWVEVADNGPGIPEEQLDTLFSIFESTKGARGTGIGLAVSQKILREHGGQIVLDSKPNQGTRFRLIWPACEDEGNAASRRTVESD